MQGNNRGECVPVEAPWKPCESRRTDGRRPRPDGVAEGLPALFGYGRTSPALEEETGRAINGLTAEESTGEDSTGSRLRQTTGCTVGGFQMNRRFGLGPEMNTDYSPSKQHARALFLKLLPRLRDQVIPTLFEAARLPFLEFLTDSRDEILSISRDIDSPPCPTDKAMRIFVSGWAALQRQELSGALCELLQNWASGLNLNADWCLDHAVSTLREAHLEAESPQEAWQHAIEFELNLGSVCVQNVFDAEFRSRGLDQFTYRYEGLEFTEKGPLAKSARAFRIAAERRLEALGGEDVTGAKTSLNHQIAEYLEKFRKLMKSLKFTEPPKRLSDERFEWFILYQVPPDRKTVSELSADALRDRKTIREGLEAVTNLLILERAPPPTTWKARAGRPAKK